MLILVNFNYVTIYKLFKTKFRWIGLYYNNLFWVDPMFS